jgi:pyruvate ferredoxin oxidoreductase delta subunit
VSTAKTWKEIPLGGLILEAGNAETYKTGDWRSMRPILHKDKCVNCLNCWIVCPDTAVVVKDEKLDHIDYDHCKGCGLCAAECPVNCIDMQPEGDFR